MESIDKTAQVFHALSHPRRVMILRCLMGRNNEQIAVGALQRETKIPAASLTHHLQIMERSGVLAQRTKGRFTFYTLDSKILARVLGQVQNLIDMGIGTDHIEPAARHQDTPKPKIPMPMAPPPPTKRFLGLRG
ncbi:hypothetical protein BFP76_03360 [Amylibacter kogurei]|uniref:HTH arsR-type domain-containing protein n=1 Tax=Paramylibacter kogurei TaxID=1889778 RepID=A0A2G5K5H3_9RHOB|nr:metalloregulator ArsR/SmtB family transcription factor [Amylibacter kogurei]PIB24273.1 hypothetical protein BFP76_03360 [Amylibacter kogurei]